MVLVHVALEALDVVEGVFQFNHSGQVFLIGSVHVLELLTVKAYNVLKVLQSICCGGNFSGGSASGDCCQVVRQLLCQIPVLLRFIPAHLKLLKK